MSAYTQVGGQPNTPAMRICADAAVVHHVRNVVA